MYLCPAFDDGGAGVGGFGLTSNDAVLMPTSLASSFCEAGHPPVLTDQHRTFCLRDFIIEDELQRK